MSDERAYLEHYHATHVTPEAVLSRVVVRATGSSLEVKTRLTDGSNEAYLVTTASGRQCFLKIPLLSDGDLCQEQWAADQCRAAGAPVPEVLLVGEEEGVPFMVQAAAPGRPLSLLLPRLSEAERALLWPQLGAALGAIHSVSVDGFWKRDPEGAWDFADWTSVMNSTLRDRGEERPFLLQAGFGEHDCDEMMRLLRRYRDEFDCPQPVLCHSDFLPEHIFVTDDLRLGAVVDFGDCCGGHPVWDLAVVHEAEEMDFAAILRGYPGAWVADARFEDRLYLQRLALDMGYTAHLLRDRPGNPWAELHARALRTTLAWLLGHGW